MLLRDWAVFIVVDSSTSMKVITRWNVREQQKYQVDVKGLMLAWHGYCCHVARTIAFSIIVLLRENRSRMIKKIKILFIRYIWHITIVHENRMDDDISFLPSIIVNIINMILWILTFVFLSCFQWFSMPYSNYVVLPHRMFVNLLPINRLSNFREHGLSISKIMKFQLKMQIQN